MMRLTSRRRFVLAALIAWPLLWAYFLWCIDNGKNIVRVSRGGYPDCGSWRSFGNGCTPGSFHQVQAWVEIFAFTAVALSGLALIARWVLAPVRQMADTVGRLGPTSLGLRLGVGGPREETKRLADAVDAMLDRVAEGYEAQRRFAANASHELRTPLATQRALIEVSLAEALTPEQLDLLSRQLLATNARNEALIEGLLVLAETERGLIANTPQRLDLITAAIVESFRPAAKEAGIEIEADVEPVEVAGEAPLLERLVTNLVQNALKYNVPSGSIDIRVESNGTLTVANSGQRVPPDRVAGLFEPFRRGTGDRLDHGGGVGLGLTIARSVVAAHLGRIDATANPDGGLTVRVTLSPVTRRRALRSDDDDR